LSKGSWRNLIHDLVPGLSGVDPVLDAAALAHDLAGPTTAGRTLRERVTIIGPSPRGFRMLSDVTMDDDETYRPASVNRLTSAIVRAARLVGETAVFENNGQELWTRLRERMVNLLAGLWANGALGGSSAEEAFEVRCDRSTMTQNDLDAGRVLCRITFTAAMPIVQITIVLAMEEGGNISVASREALAAPQSQAA
jgi:phage tail sheath protein FI